jgi:hypothetical protein
MSKKKRKKQKQWEGRFKIKKRVAALVITGGCLLGLNNNETYAAGPFAERERPAQEWFDRWRLGDASAQELVLARQRALLAQKVASLAVEIDAHNLAVAQYCQATASREPAFHLSIGTPTQSPFFATESLPAAEGLVWNDRRSRPLPPSEAWPNPSVPLPTQRSLVPYEPPRSYNPSVDSPYGPGAPYAWAPTGDPRSATPYWQMNPQGNLLLPGYSSSPGYSSPGYALPAPR